MNGGVTVVLCIVGALVLCEAVLPRALAALRRRRQERAEAATVRTDAVTVVGDAPTAAVRCPLPSVPTSENAESAKAPERCDPRSDGEDLASVYKAARTGRPEAMVKIGDYAYCRGAIVEAFYWTILAELNGADGLDEALFEMRTRWLAEGCPPEFENAYADFTEEQGKFARAVLCLQCDVAPQYAYARLQELADSGNEAAQLFLLRETEGAVLRAPRFRSRMKGRRLRA